MKILHLFKTNINKSLKAKTAFLIIFLLLISIGSSLIINIIQYRNKMKAALEREIYASGVLVRNTINKNLEYFPLDRFSGMPDFLQGILNSNQTISYIFISDDQKKVIYHSSILPSLLQLDKTIYSNEILGLSFKTIALENFYESLLPIFKDEKIIGHIHLGVNKQIIDSEIVSLVFQTILIFIGALLFSIFLLFYFISKNIVSPITKLSKEMIDISQNMNLNKEIQIKGGDEVSILGKTFNKMLGDIRNYSKHLEVLVDYRTDALNKANSELENANALMKKDLAMAKSIQEAIIPKIFPELKSLNFGGIYLPMEDLGGDYYDIFKISESKLGIVIVDVSGHGVSAALITSMAKMAFNNQSQLSLNVSEIVTAVNKEMFKIIGKLKDYLTAFYGIIDLETGIFEFSNAGHPPALLYNHSQKTIEELDSKGFFIGIIEKAQYHSGSSSLISGDKILFYTDGVTEVRNLKGELYGKERLKNSFFKYGRESLKDLLELIIKDVEVFQGNRPIGDDIAMLALEFVHKKEPANQIEDTLRILTDKKRN